MTDAELIYNALLRAERRMEADVEACDPSEGDWQIGLGMLRAIALIREEIGRGLAEDGAAIVKAKIGEVG